MLKRLIIGAAVIAALAAQCTLAHAGEPYGCITFEDDSFVCGTLTTDDNDRPIVDWSKPFRAGCIPGGVCDDEYQAP